MLDMKASFAAQPALPIPNPEDWCSVKWAAERLNRSERTVRRMAAGNLLRIYSARVATKREQADMCWVPEVEQLRDALMRSGKLLSKTGWRRGESTNRAARAVHVTDEVRYSLTPNPSHMAVRAGLITPTEGTPQ